MSDGFDFAGLGDAVGGIASGIGGLFEASGYDQASKIASENARLTKLSTGIQEEAETRKAYQSFGATQAALGAGGFSLSGSGLDILHSSMQQAALQKTLVNEQGLIEQHGWEEKAAADAGAAAAAAAGGAGDIVGGVLKSIPIIGGLF